jgi:methylmalonyl-CoA mutase cobalamin-binding subunit
LQTPTSKLIILSDRKTGRTDDAVTRLVEELRKAGYSKVMVAGFISERL